MSITYSSDLKPEEYRPNGRVSDNDGNWILSPVEFLERFQLLHELGNFPHGCVFINAYNEAKTWCETHNIPEDHGLAHAMNVVENSRRALVDFKLTTDEKLMVLLASLFHDLEDRKFVTSENLSGTREILHRIGISNNSTTSINQVIKMIELVSCSKNGNTIDQSLPLWFYIPRDADRLEALGNVGIERAYDTTLNFIKKGKVQSCFYNNDTPRCRNEEELNIVANKSRMLEYMKTGFSSSMIDHFYDKLLHIHELSSGSKTLQQMANERRQIMIDFVLDFGKKGEIDWELFEKKLGKNPEKH